MGGGEILKEGYLVKSPPDKSRKKWRKRWFCLRSSRILEYYSSAQGSLKGVVNLEDCMTVHMTMAHKKHKHVFGIETRSRLYFLVASSEDEMKEWVEAITAVCGLVMAEGSTHISKVVATGGGGGGGGGSALHQVECSPVHIPANQSTPEMPRAPMTPTAQSPAPKKSVVSSSTELLPETSANWPYSVEDATSTQERVLAQERESGSAQNGYDIPRMALESSGYSVPRHMQKGPVSTPYQGISPPFQGTSPSQPLATSRLNPSAYPALLTDHIAPHIYNVPRGASSLPHVLPSKKEGVPAIQFDDLDLPLEPRDGVDSDDDERYVNVLRTPLASPLPVGPPPVDRSSKPQPPKVDRDLKPGGSRLSIVEGSSSDGDMPRISARTVAYTLVSFTTAPNQPLTSPLANKGASLRKPRPSNYTQVDMVATQALAAKNRVHRQASAPVSPCKPTLVPRAQLEVEFENDDDDDDGGSGGGSGLFVDTSLSLSKMQLHH